MHTVSRRSACLIVLAASQWAPVTRSAAGDEVPLAIQGYDPVAYFTDAKPVRGRPETTYDWDGYRYRFATDQHRQLFQADPARYAPQFANLCAMALTRGDFVEANPAYWLISDGKLYLFGKPNGPALFRQGLTQHIAQAKQNEPHILSR
ncbi:MAG TPA: YHS domain-containing (seleno)protein [Acetobacteraceae bacterium]|nr:YHS domain-containing (seleno)protein [Acetobacteraceae bacterium]